MAKKNKYSTAWIPPIMIGGIDGATATHPDKFRHLQTRTEGFTVRNYAHAVVAGGPLDPKAYGVDNRFPDKLRDPKTFKRECMNQPKPETETPLTDSCPMPLGVHKGKAMEDVPAQYLAWYREEARQKDKRLMEYISDNWDAIQLELKKGKR